MNPLIFFEKTKENSEFEAFQVKKSLKEALEYQGVNSVNSLYDETYDLIHFITLEDYIYYSKSIKKNVKKVLNLFSCEEDFSGRILKEVKNKETQEIQYIIDKNDIEIINSSDAITVPSLESKKFLESFGVTPKIYVMPIPIKLVKYNLTNTILNKAIYHYLQYSTDSYIVYSVIYYKDYEAFNRIIEISKTFPKLKFVVISQNKKALFTSLKMKNILKNKPINLNIIDVISDDLYSSLLFNAKIFLNVSSSFGNNQEINEAFASKTQVMSLKFSQFNDISIDKETSYIYNDLDSLKEGINQYINGLIDSTIEEAYIRIKEKNISAISEKVIKIYKDILEE